MPLAGGAAGPAGARLQELGAGLRSTWLPLGALAVVLLSAFSLAGGGAAGPATGFFGVALAAVAC